MNDDLTPHPGARRDLTGWKLHLPAGAGRLAAWAIRAALLLVMLSLIRPPQVLVTLGDQQTVVTRNDLAGVHTLFTNEVEEWKIQRGLSMIREMGAPWIVEFFPWAYSEPSKGQFDWSNAERIVSHAERQGVRVIARLGFVPEWARPDPSAGSGQTTPSQTTFTYLDPDHFQDFAEFAAAFAAHFKGRIGHLVIWNEPNLSGEWGMRPIDPAGYVAMLRAVYPAVKQANPDVMVLAGALAPTLEPQGSAQGLNDLVYLEEMYAALMKDEGGRRKDEGRRMKDESENVHPSAFILHPSSFILPPSSFILHPYDAWAIHSYGRTAPPDESPAPDRINFRRTELLREIMLRYGDGDLPVYITESGWNDDPRWAFGVTPAQRIEYTLGAWEYARANWPWAKCVAVWVFKQPAPAHNYRDHFVFVTPSLEPLPIYVEVQKALVP